MTWLDDGLSSFNFASRKIFSVLIKIKPADNLDARVARRYHARMGRRRKVIQR